MARSFNGTTAYIDLGTSSTLSWGSAGTIAMMVKITAGDAVWRPLINLALDDGFGGWWFGTDGSSKIQVYKGATSTAVASTGTVDDGAWHHIAVTWDSSLGSNRIKIFIDGVLDSQFNSDSTLSNNTGSGWHTEIGYDDGFVGSFFKGSAANMFISTSAWSADEVAAAAKGIHPAIIRSSGLICFLPILGTESPESDRWRNRFNGTLTATAQDNHPALFWIEPVYANGQVVASVAAPRRRPQNVIAIIRTAMEQLDSEEIGELQDIEDAEEREMRAKESV